MTIYLPTNGVLNDATKAIQVILSAREQVYLNSIMSKHSKIRQKKWITGRQLYQI